MQVDLIKELANNSQALAAQDILQNCVHCGFCLSVCPTYGILGDEANSPRGRIYTIKAMLEGEAFNDSNLDKCLICKSCETTCPSGVDYSHLLDIAKEHNYNNKSVAYKSSRFALRKFLTTPFLVNLLRPTVRKLNDSTHLPKQVILHTGCVQKPLAPNINIATTKVLNTLGFGVLHTQQKECCGAVDIHNGGKIDGLVRIKKNIDIWEKQLESADCIVSTASGCGLMIKEYSKQFAKDDEYYQKAQHIVQHTLDISEFLEQQDLSVLNQNNNNKNIKIAYHEPCTLQHGQKLTGLTSSILKKAGYEVTTPKDNHLCCGSAGTYSVFQPTISKQLREQKIEKLGECGIIATSNIGCLLHLQKGTNTPVKHWIELLV